MRVLLADDQKEVRSALELILEQEQNVQVVGTAEGAGSLVQKIAENQVDLVLLDWELPGFSPELLASLREEFPQVCFIALSGRHEARQASLAAGADAFVSKGDPPELLLQALYKLA